MFEMLRECEPWDRFCDRSSQALGYFNLFHLEHPLNRYVVRKAGETGGHDDWFFTTSFPPECRRQIPMTVIHTGAPATNWAGRVAESYHAEGAGESCGELPAEIAGKGSVAVIGYFPGSRWREMARQFGKVLLVDHFQVHHPSGSAMVEADRAVLRGLWESEAAERGNVELLGTHSAGTLAWIADGSLEALYLPGEVTPEWLTVALRHWGPKLRDGALVCGDLYGLPHWPDSTYAISLLLGVPDKVWASGFWCQRIDRHAAALDWLGRGRQPMGRQRGVVFTILAGDELAGLLVSLHALRRHWGGPVAVFHWGEEDRSLEIACVRCGVELCTVGVSSAMPGGRAAGEWMAEAIWMSPYERTLLLPVGTMVTSAIEVLFGEETKVAKPDGAAPLLAVRMAGVSRICAVPFSSAMGFESDGTVGKTGLLVCAGAVEKWTDAAWEVWCEAEAAMTAAFAARVRVAARTTIVTCVDAKSVADFERNWLTWNFDPAVPVLLFLIGLNEADFWLGGARQPTAMIRIAADEIPRKLTEVIDTEFFILLPPTASAMPGAELFLAPVWNDGDLALHAAFVELDPAVVCGRVRTAAFQSLVASGSISVSHREKLPSLLQSAAVKAGTRVRTVDVSRWGWKGLPTLDQDTVSPALSLPGLLVADASHL